jgi:hypothetical protein
MKIILVGAAVAVILVLARIASALEKIAEKK